MTKYAARIKPSSAPYRSQKFHVIHPGARPTALNPRQRLYASRDAPEEAEELAFYRRLHSYRGRDDHGHRTLEDDDGGEWADESTLIAMLQENDSLDGEDCDVAGLLGRLSDAMVAYGPGLRDYLRNALIPTVHHQTRLHTTLRDRIDTSFATGILSVDQVCKNVESFRLKDEDDVSDLYSGVKVRMGQIQTQIAAMEAERKRMLEVFEREAIQRLNAIASIAEGMPAHLENLLSKLEKKCKEQEKENPDLEKSVAALLRLQMN